MLGRLLFATFLLDVLAEECTRDADIVRQILTGDQGAVQPAGKDGPLVVDVGLEVTSMTTVAHTNTMNVDVIITRTWNDPSLYFAHLQPCRPYVNLFSYRSNLWIPELSFPVSNGVHKHGITLQLSRDGTLVHSARMRQNIPCKTSALDYPFGNTTCTLVWRNEVNSRDNQQMKWDNNALTKPLGENDIEQVGDLILLKVRLNHNELFRQNGVFDELTAVFTFRRGHYKILLLFFLPSMLFITISWLSLSLGPMAITRSILIIGSLVLLLIHYYTNMAGLPETTGVTSIDVWKVFSIVFVVAILLELVVVTCMASMGRSTKWTSCCHRRRRKGMYELEPLYEELNDLRTRTTRRTCGCCRYSALFLDCISLWISAAVFVLFTLLFFTRGQMIIKWLNEINLKTLNTL
ncbi:hypothetical protein Y032_0010g896 [Ancylostoma ceylanicum]|nr:hypothetical protein Y032_0010g896 [Ancylostoma ceylanicum]